ncbi:mandelate racemase/muconate lactonizing enzyme family protein [soil metagenome]
MKKQLELFKKKENDNSLNRRNFLKKASIGGFGMGLLGTVGSKESLAADFKESSNSKIKITDLKCAVIGSNPVVRIVTDAGLSGYGQIESSKPYLKSHVLFYKDYLLGEDPTNVERVMMKIRRMGSFKPWGSSVSAIEMALWDLAGKAANLPVYKLMGGKIRDQVRAYNGSVQDIRFPWQGTSAQHYADWGDKVRNSKEGFTIVKEAAAFHSRMPREIANFDFRNVSQSPDSKADRTLHRAPLTTQGFKAIIDHAEGLRKGLGDDFNLALDLGPGFMLSDAIRVANALEPYNFMWLEDMLTGDYTPYVLADDYRELTQSTNVPIHTGEQLYLRQNHRELIDRHAVDVLGPDPADIGGIAEMKWVAQHADLYGILFAPHGTFNGLLGLAAQVQVGATMPENYIAFEYPAGNPTWWYDIVEGLPDPIIKDGLINVMERPGMGVDFNIKAAKKYLSNEDKNFFD